MQSAVIIIVLSLKSDKNWPHSLKKRMKYRIDSLVKYPIFFFGKNIYFTFTISETYIFIIDAGRILKMY